MDRLRKYQRQVLLGALVALLGILDLLLVVGSTEVFKLNPATEQAEQQAIVRLNEQVSAQRQYIEEHRFPRADAVKNLALETIQEGKVPEVQIVAFTTVERAEDLAGTPYLVLQNSLELRGPLEGILKVLDRLSTTGSGRVSVTSIDARQLTDEWSLKVLVKVYAEKP